LSHTPEERKASIAAAQKKYAASPKGKAAKARYRQTPGGKAVEAKKARVRRGIVDATGEVRDAPCEICGTVARLCCDHDHATGKTRGWLCTPCNAALGLFGDTLEGLQRAVRYMEASGG
jgi:hypothetical protein